MENIGSLEEIVLLILLNQKKAHAVEISEIYEDTLTKAISLPAIHVVLKRMEKKGWVKSSFGEPTAERGGKRKRNYEATSDGYSIIQQLQEAKSKLWNNAVKPTLDYVQI